MPNESYKEDWKRCGDLDPYYGVLSHDKFRNRQLTTEARDEFFQSGEEHVARILEKIRLHVDDSFIPSRTLDFGCGVGRLVIPFSKVSRQVTGIDISDGMLAEARANCGLAGASNVAFAKSIEEASGPFDLVHSYIVFQHIPSAIGARLIEQLMGLVADNGIIAVHLNYSNQGPVLRRRMAGLRSRVKLLHYTLNLFQNRPAREPLLQMNAYDLNRIMPVFQKHHFTDLHLSFTHHAASLGLMLIGKKGRSAYEF